MNLYLQYHNVQNEGLILDNPPFSATRLAIHPPPNVQKADGRVFLIAGIGRPRRFFLWESFQIEAVKSNGEGEFDVSGIGWQLAPPVELSGKLFENFKAACANFVGFRRISDLPFSRTLNKLAEDIQGQLVTILDDHKHRLLEMGRGTACSSPANSKTCCQSRTPTHWRRRSRFRRAAS